jgi:clan AA aspartic protease (TIGR02281 family)
VKRIWVSSAVLSAWILVGSGSAPAEIYSWTDEQGKLHFTQSLDQVPPRHRPEASAKASDARPSRLQIYETPERSDAPTAALSARKTLRIPFERRGALMLVDVQLNDQLTAPFLVDTGASGISIPRAVADRLGMPIGPSTRRVYVHTANGLASRPLVRLDSVQLGEARLEGAEATVNPTMDFGLLGGTFFNNFIYRVDAAESVITLQPNEAMRSGLGAEDWRERFRRVREPLQRLEQHLDSVEISRPGRRAELEQKRTELRARLDELELEANRVGVPAAWRE